MYQYMERVGTSPTNRAAAKLLLLTMVRKSELTNATWSEINFSEALWTIPKERMKRRNPHLVFLSQQALDIFIDRKSTRLNSSHVAISYAVFCLKKKTVKIVVNISTTKQ